MAGDVTYSPGSIGATQDALSRFILSSDDILIDVASQLQRKTPFINEQGRLEYRDIKGEKPYSEECIAWMLSKIKQLLNKNTYLSQITKPEEMSKISWEIQRAFLFELLTRHNEFKLEPNGFLELAHMHMNYLDFAIRRPLYKSEKIFLGQTSSENTSTLTQHSIDESTKRGGLLGTGLFSNEKRSV